MRFLPACSCPAEGHADHAGAGTGETAPLLPSAPTPQPDPPRASCGSLLCCTGLKRLLEEGAIESMADLARPGDPGVTPARITQIMDRLQWSRPTSGRRCLSPGNRAEPRPDVPAVNLSTRGLGRTAVTVTGDLPRFSETAISAQLQSQLSHCSRSCRQACSLTRRQGDR
jgi:hypothetical protein